MPTVQPTILSEALRLHDRGLWIVPCDGKKPTRKNWPTQRWSRDDLNAALSNGRMLNIAIVLNQSNLIDVECDSDEAETRLQELFGGTVPSTPTWKSKRGLHRLFKRPDGLPEKAKVEIDGVDLRIGNGKGALSVVPPSIHPDGPRYRWLPGLSIHQIEPAELPSSIVERIRSIDLIHSTKLRDVVPNGTRNKTLFRLACSMRSHGTTHETIERALLLENDLRCDPPLREADVRQIAKSAVRYDPGCDRPDGNSSIDLISLASPVLGEAAYHGFAGEFIRAVTPYTEATDAGILAHLLSATGAMIGDGPHVYAGAKQPARVSVVLVGPTSTGRKGTSFGPTDQLLRDTDEPWRSRWQRQCVRGLSSGEGLINAVADKETIDEDGNRTTEPVEKRLFVLEPEFAKVLAHSKRDGNILSHVMRESFDSGNLQTLTRNSPLRADGAHICIVGHITPEELRKCLNELHMANGFGNRFLWFYVESQRELPDAPPIPDNLIKEFADRLGKILTHAERRTNGPSRGRVKRDDDAGDVWRSVYSYLRASKPGLQGAMLARGETIVLRLALIHALLDMSSTIRREHLEAALAVWQYNEESVRLLFSDKVGDSLAEKVFDVLQSGPLETREFYRHIAKPAKEIQAALAYLESIGRIRKTKVTRKGPGRPALVWERVENG